MLQLFFLLRRKLCQREKVVSDVWRLWNTDTMQTETFSTIVLLLSTKCFVICRSYVIKRDSEACL